MEYKSERGTKTAQEDPFVYKELEKKWIQWFRLFYIHVVLGEEWRGGKRGWEDDHSEFKRGKNGVTEINKTKKKQQI